MSVEAFCSHCGLAPVAVKRTERNGREWRDLCRRCYQALYRTGKMPSWRATWYHRRRLGRL